MTENQLQRAVVYALRLCLEPPTTVFHIPNGGLRSKVEAARFKGAGVLPGIPDLCILTEGGKTLFIELKSAKGRVSAAQKMRHAELRALGHRVEICRSVVDVALALTKWGIPHRISA